MKETLSLSFFPLRKRKTKVDFTPCIRRRRKEGDAAAKKRVNEPTKPSHGGRTEAERRDC
jgi:hypothetical protein